MKRSEIEILVILSQYLQQLITLTLNYELHINVKLWVTQ